MKYLVLLFNLCLFITINAQHILQRENGVIFNGSTLIAPPNLNAGFGSAADGIYGDSLSYFYEEQNNSYNGIDLVGSSWMSYGDLLPKVLPGIVSVGLGFNPDTFKWEFTVDSIFVDVKDAETSNSSSYRFEYTAHVGAFNGIDSLHIYDTTLIEPSLVKVYDDISLVSIRNRTFLNVLKIYPNPCQAFIQVILPKDVDFENVIIQDLNGKSYPVNFDFEESSYKLNLEFLNIGIYILSFQSKEGIWYHEKIKKE